MENLPMSSLSWFSDFLKILSSGSSAPLVKLVILLLSGCTICCQPPCRIGGVHLNSRTTQLSHLTFLANPLTVVMLCLEQLDLFSLNSRDYLIYLNLEPFPIQLLSKAWQIELIFRAGSLWDMNSNIFPKLFPMESNHQKAPYLHFIILVFHTHHFIELWLELCHQLASFAMATCRMSTSTEDTIHYVLPCFFYKGWCGKWLPPTTAPKSSEPERAWSLLTYQHASFLFWVMRIAVLYIFLLALTPFWSGSWYLNIPLSCCSSCNLDSLV